MRLVQHKALLEELSSLFGILGLLTEQPHLEVGLDAHFRVEGMGRFIGGLLSLDRVHTDSLGPRLFDAFFV